MLRGLAQELGQGERREGLDQDRRTGEGVEVLSGAIPLLFGRGELALDT